MKKRKKVSPLAGEEVRKLWRTEYDRRVFNLFYSKWKIEGMTDEEQRFVKRSLFFKGKVSAIDAEGTVVFVDSASVDFNIYDSPLFATPVQKRGAPFIPNRPLRTYAIGNDSPEEVESPEIVIGYALPTRTPYRDLFAMKIEEIVDLEMAKRTNRFAAKMPFLFKSTPENETSISDLASRIMDDDIAIFVEESEASSVEGLSTGIPFILDRLESERVSVWNEILSILGIDNSGNRKAEREIVDEVNANNMLIEDYARIFETEFGGFLDRVNSAFGSCFRLVDADPEIDSFHEEASKEKEESEDAVPED